ncbi:Segregation and condensation protein A [Mycoplasmopsis meleagridis]|uniref:Segregation and condensation protein A n=1 Tax=Mycoplasmopsis meleagridis ATCC 25294 TaxID=1264554 RepID=A0A0F5H0E1_9BACT|nr:segregation/condensation protein A [Mycoplasmopsis meleagridis]KKB26668.1 Segregation and condensation protein A [Mycoplasmopsis meleagridis ATCC 25294]OAD18217.1 Segregation and condensation protein A [Mycoplasmopsis meleagridis]VEU77723.1 segregation and condensation protein A [Mycoplasmopsis meleagridis]
MATRVSLYETEDKKYDIKLENFDGPLDLLLALVQEKRIDIMDVDLVELATEYLRIVNNWKDKLENGQNENNEDASVLGDYLVMASTLLLLKTKMLLYTPEEKPEIEESKREILQRLYEYQQFKEVSKALREQEGLRKDIFIKKASNVDEFIIDDDKLTIDGHSNPLKLILVLRKMFERAFANQLKKTKLDHFDKTPKDQIPFILNLFENHEVVTFEMIFTQPTLNHFVITLMAVLDLARRQIIRIYQEEDFGILKFEKGPEYEE